MMPDGNKRALVLSDGRPGHFNQSIALCRHLGVEFELVEVTFRSSFTRGLSHVFDLFGFHSASLFRVGEFDGAFQMVVSAGSRTYYANKVLAAKLGAQSVAVLAPRGYRWNYDCIVVPEYDAAKPLANVVTMPVNMTYLDDQLVAEKVVEFRHRHPAGGKPAWGVIVGGDSAGSKMDAVKMTEAMALIEAMRTGGELWVTTSRRTPTEIETDLRRRSIDFLHLYSEESYNPIPAFVQLCDRLFVTDDSTAMLSECVTAGSAAVDVLLVSKKTETKQHRFVQCLAKGDAVTVLGESESLSRVKIDLSQVAVAVQRILAKHSSQR